MNPDDLVKQAKRIIEKGKTSLEAAGLLAEATDFLRVYAGEKSAFFINLRDINRGVPDRKIIVYISDMLEGFIRYVENGLIEGVSIERKAQIDVVSDFLSQANTLLDSKDVHPAAPTVIIGAALEEFLRNWIEESGLDVNDKKPSLDTYAKILREADLITKQDLKDITSWAGLRNHAAHGEWDEVSDKKRIYLMLEGVNLFMRKYVENGDDS